jgi:hypothetical protein
MAAKKLTRKEIVQQDVIRKTLTDTSNWAISNFKLLVGALVVVLATTAGVILWQQYSGSRQAQLQAAFADALEIYHAPVGAEATQNQDNAVKPKYTFRPSTRSLFPPFRTLHRSIPDRGLVIFQNITRR